MVRIMDENGNDILVEVIQIAMDMERQLLVRLKRIPGVSFWNKVLLLEKQNLQWRVASVALVEIAYEDQDTIACVLEPVGHKEKLQEGMILVCKETNESD